MTVSAWTLVCICANVAFFFFFPAPFFLRFSSRFQDDGNIKRKRRKDDEICTFAGMPLAVVAVLSKLIPTAVTQEGLNPAKSRMRREREREIRNCEATKKGIITISMRFT